MSARIHAPGSSIQKLALHVCVLMSLLVITIAAIALVSTPSAYAAYNLKEVNVTIDSGLETKTYDALKQVVTLNKNSSENVTIEVIDDAPDGAIRSPYLIDSSGKESMLSFGIDKSWTIPMKDFANTSKIVIRSFMNGITGYIYEKQVNIRFVEGKKTEEISNFSFSNGLSYTFRNTGFKFLEGTTFNLNALKLPVTYKHEPDGTTTVGINCSPEDKDFFLACKNGNVWQKYSSDAIQKKIKEADKGWDGKKLGKWGGKAMDWNICGYMQYNTNNPKAPRTVNLIVSCGIKADGHAQYLIFTGTLTFTAGGKATLVGSLTPMPTGGNKISGKFGLGAYGGLELYVGVGLNYVASVGAYGKGTINVDLQVLPEFFLDKVTLGGSVGVKAKAFGFTVATWEILNGSKPLYDSKKNKNAPTPQDYVLNKSSSKTAGATEASANAGAANQDGSATSMSSVSADVPYPADSRDYLNAQGDQSGTEASEQQAEAPLAAQSEQPAAEASDTPLMAQEAVLTAAQENAGGIRTNTYGETELGLANAGSTPVMVYVMDANQIEGAEKRDSLNRSALVYSRRGSDGKWSTPIMIDSSSTSKNFADYSPTITSDGTNCYVAWLGADSKIESGATIADVGKKLDVKVATIGPNDGQAGNVVVETVKEESDATDSIPASPKAIKTSDGLYVGWYTNAASGSNGEVLGLSGEHRVNLYKKGDSNWTEVSTFTTGNGAITSFDVGVLGNDAVCAFSLDSKFKEHSESDMIGAFSAIRDSTTYLLASNTASGSAQFAECSTNAQFTTKNGKSVLTYAKFIIADNDGGPYLSIMSKDAVNASEVTELDGKSVELPTTGYKLMGDLARAGECTISFLCSANNTTDIQAMVHKGTSNKDWSAKLAATSVSAVVTDYAQAYVNDKPFFVYSTSNNKGDLSAMAEEDDGGVDLYQSTDESLIHFNIDDISYDEISYDSGAVMPIEVTFTNDGMIGVGGADLYVLDGDTVEKVGSFDSDVEVGDTCVVTYNYKLPDKGSIDKAKDFVFYAAAKNETVTKEDILISQDIDSSFEIGKPYLVLETEHLLIDGQESVKATVTNKGLAAQSATLVFEQAMTGDNLKTVEVPALEEDESFEFTYDAPAKYFRKSGVEDMTVMLENDGSDEFALSNTEFIDTWEIDTGTVPMFRLYNPNSGEHFYTADITERDNLVGYGWHDEGVGWTAPESSDTPVYRLYNENGGEHHYTMNADERDNLKAAGWNDEGTGWYSDDNKGVALLREYNPNQFSCNHNYTTNKEEHDYLVSIGWKDEGTAWYGIAE